MGRLPVEAVGQGFNQQTTEVPPKQHPLSDTIGQCRHDDEHQENESEQDSVGALKSDVFIVYYDKRGMWYNNRKYSTGGNDFGKEKTIEKG